MKKTILILLIILISIAPALAQSVEIDLVDERPEATPGGDARYNLIITNNRDVETTYTIKANPLAVHPFSNIIQRVKSEPGTITLSPGSSEEVVVTIDIKEEVPPQQKFQTSVFIESATSSIKEEFPLVIDIRAPDQLVLISSNFPDEIIPGNNQEFSITYEATTNQLHLDTIVTVRSDFFEQSFEGPIHFKSPLTKTIPFDVISQTEPGQYELEIIATEKGKELGSYTKTFQIVKNPDVVEETERTDGLLRKEVIITKRNNGNLAVQESVRIPITKFQDFFTLTDPLPTSQDEVAYNWNFELQPGEEQTVQVRIDYTSFAVAIILLLVVLILMHYFLKPKITIKKEITHIKTEKDGVSEVKIKLIVKNRGKNMQNVRVVDTIPQLMKTTGHYGTLKPKMIKKSAHGQKVVWEFTEFHKREVRILTYVVHSKMHIVGAVRLPAAHVLIKQAKKTQNYKSNTLIFSVKKPSVKGKKK